MFSDEVRSMLLEVISSWQVIAVTVVLVIYISIVKSVARTRRTRRISASKPKKKIFKKRSAPSTPAKSKTDELGLEESEDADK